MIHADGRMDRHEEANSHFAQICESTEKGLNETFNEKKSTKVHHAFVLYDLLVVIKKKTKAVQNSEVESSIHIFFSKLQL